jgi:hypothetical protein
VAVADVASPPPGLELPAFVVVDGWILERVAGDFPDELVYFTVAGSGPCELWIKSAHLLEGPWEWIVMQGGAAVDFSSRRLATRTDAIAELADYLARTQILGPAADPDFATVEAAAPTTSTRPAAPAALAAIAGAARPDGSEDDEVLGLALDLAIASLRKVRARYGAAASSPGG